MLKQARISDHAFRRYAAMTISHVNEGLSIWNVVVPKGCIDMEKAKFFFDWESPSMLNKYRVGFDVEPFRSNGGAIPMFSLIRGIMKGSSKDWSKCNGSSLLAFKYYSDDLEFFKYS